MDSFFGVGLPELFVILIIAGIVMGPERIGLAARWLGRNLAQLQLMTRSFVQKLNAELEAADQSGEFKAAMQEVQELRREVTELRSELLSTRDATESEAREAVREFEELANRTIRPPHLTAPESVGDGEDPEAGAPAPDLPRLKAVGDDPE